MKKDTSNNYVSEQVFSSRIVSHGRIENLTDGFRLKDEQPFSLYIRPKSVTTVTTDVLVNARLYKDSQCSPVPVSVYCWQELMVVELDASNDALLETYEIYWGAGNTGVPAE